jgi:hypothetical protein
MNGIGIQLDGDHEFLETEPGTTISMRLENPLFGDAEKLSPGSYSYPFSIPGGKRSPSNAAKLKNPDVIENTESYQIQKARLFFNGVPLKDGNLKANEVGDEKISAYFTFGINSLSPFFKHGTLRTWINHIFTISSANIVKKIYFTKLSGGSIAVIANGKEYIQADGPAKWTDLKVQMEIDGQNETMDQNDKWWPVITNISASGSTPSGLITGGYVTINLRQYYHDEFDVIQYRDCQDPLQELSIKVDASVADDYVAEADLGNYYNDFATFLSSYKTVIPTSEIIRFPTVFNAKLHADVTKESEAINLWDSDGFVLNDPNYGIENDSPWTVKNYTSLQPFVRLRWVLDRIALLLGGVELEGDFITDPHTDDLLIDNSVSLDVPQGFIGENKFIFWRRSFSANELLPDMSIVEFLKALQSRYNIAIYYNEATKKVKMSYREPIAKNIIYDDITSITSPMKPAKDERYTGYTVRCPKEKYDDFSSEEYVIEGDSEKEFKVNCGRLFQSKSIFHDGALMEGPYKSQPHNAEYAFRMFHYAGIVDNGEFDYPKATIHGSSRNEELDDIHDAYWKYWLFYDKNRLVVPVNINYPLRKLLAFDWELKRRYNRNNYLIKSLDVKLTNRGMEVTAAELYTMR